MQAQTQYLLDRAQPFNNQKAQILDQLTQAITNASPHTKEANEVWEVLKKDHYFWTNVDQVLQLCQFDQTKFFMLVLLQDNVKQKWPALPQEQQLQLRNFVVGRVIELGSMEGLPKTRQNILAMLNAVLVQIVKYDWNGNWNSFIPDICEASGKNQNICENNFSILKMLSEEIFDHSRNTLTQNQIRQLKQQMNKDFTTIFKLCEQVLENIGNIRPSLVRACLQTLNAFLSWIPLYYIIYTDLIGRLCQLFPSDYLRNHALSCLVEIAALPIDTTSEEEKMKFLFMLQRVTEELSKLIPITEDEQKITNQLQTVRKKHHSVFEVLARGIANFYSEFFRHQHHWVEKAVSGNDEGVMVCKYGFKYLLIMMRIDEDQVFKITIDFFHYYVGAFLEQQTKGEGSFGGMSYSPKGPSLQQSYGDIFKEVMKMVCLKMAKPEEVLIVIDEDGTPVRQEVQNTENSSLYEIQKELAQFLVRYNWSDMKRFILGEIQKQQNIDLFCFDRLNSLSWIVGSLCGSIQDRQQRSFFISTLRTLLQLCEIKKGKENKAVIASCIMYVVGQYPSFLRHNWTFLKTVIKKLFEFMREDFPGIMEMACNAFLKIARSTADQFTNIQQNQSEPYIRQIIRRAPDHIRRLHPQTLQYSFYQSMGHFISAEPNAEIQLQLMKQVLGQLLFQFGQIISNAQNNPGFLKQQEIVRKLLYFLRVNQNLAVGVGSSYAMMLDLTTSNFNKLYLYYSTQVNETVNQTGKHVLNFMTVRSMRQIKKEVIKVYTRLLDKCCDLNYPQANHILNNFIFPLGQLLVDFENSMPETKEQEFVTLFTAVLEKLNMVLGAQFLAKLVEMIFTSSLPLITSDFNSFPEIRASFFGFLKALVKYNFATLFDLDQKFFNTVLDCVIWSLRHQLNNYSDLGLELLEEILLNVNKNSVISNAFYSRYHMRILTDILQVMTDGFHKSGLDAQTKIFFIIIHVTTQGVVFDPISPEQPQGQSNSQFLYQFLVSRLSAAFPNVSSTVTGQKVRNWFNMTDEKLFKLQVGDYLVLINRFYPSEIVNSDNKG